MKKSIIKIAYFIAVVIISIFVISKLSNHHSENMTASMEEATLPMLYVMDGEDKLCSLKGYVNEMNVSYMNGQIVPLDADRMLSLKLNTYDNEISDMYFEVRTRDGSSLVETTSIDDYTSKDGYISADIVVKDLIDQDTEYMLVVVCNVGSREIRFYTRIVWSGEDDAYNYQEKIDFCKEFSDMTFDSSSASDLSKYLESSSSGDNTTYAYVNINSSSSQVTWGDLDITSHTQPTAMLLDLHDQTASVLLTYKLVVDEDKTYNIKEYFRVKYTSDRMYLLNYERTMDYIFDADEDMFSDDAINLSISNYDDIKLVESDGGSEFAFVAQGKLYSYDITEDKIAYIFGFYDSDDNDERDNLQNYSINILKIDEGGNVYFSVSGYMNRGNHEGEVGTAVYAYNATTNTTEEFVFIPSDEAEEIVMTSSDNLSVLGNNNQFYTIVGDNLYAVNLSDRTYEAVVENIINCNYEMSDTSGRIAWQDLTISDVTNEIRVMNLGTQAISVIEADDNEYIKLIGYIGDDIVYGLIKESDIHNDRMGNPVYAMYAIRIEDKDGNILEDYSVDGIYITDVEISDNQIILTRVTYDSESSLYTETTDDQIMSTLESDEGSNQLKKVSTENYEYIVQISLKSSNDSSKIQILTPKFVVFEGSKDIEINDIVDSEIYYVYYKNKVDLITTDEADALLCAYENKGVVIDNTGSYIWYSGNLLTSNQIMSITNNVEGTDYSSEDSTACCIEQMLAFEGVSVDADALISEGMSVTQILEENLSAYKILDLNGCSTDAMEYYLNQDIPVFARLSDGSAMLLIGFNSQNIVVFNPAKGTSSVYKIGINDATTLFEENGNHFVTYLK